MTAKGSKEFRVACKVFDEMVAMMGVNESIARRLRLRSRPLLHGLVLTNGWATDMSNVHMIASVFKATCKKVGAIELGSGDVVWLN